MASKYTAYLKKRKKVLKKALTRFNNSAKRVIRTVGEFYTKPVINVLNFIFKDREKTKSTNKKSESDSFESKTYSDFSIVYDLYTLCIKDMIKQVAIDPYDFTDILNEDKKAKININSILLDSSRPSMQKAIEGMLAKYLKEKNSASIMPFTGDIAELAKNINTEFVTLHNTGVRKGPPKYIAIHYTASHNSRKGQAKIVMRHFLSADKGSSDFIVDDETILQYNPDPGKYYCWACGGKGNPSDPNGSKYKGIAFNSNSIAIEVCSSYNKKVNYQPNGNDPGWYFTDAVLNNTIGLVKILMSQYNIPRENVLRHYDYTGKPCPGIIGWNLASGSNNENTWLAFKNCL